MLKLLFTSEGGTERQRDRQMNRWTDKEREKRRDREMDRWKSGQTEEQRGGETEI